MYKNRLSSASPGSAAAQLSLTHYGIPVLVAITAVGLGVVIGQGYWVFALGALAIPLVLRYPVQLGLGLFVALIPFDSIPVLAEAQKGRTLTWFVGLAAAVLLLGYGLLARRLKPPPAASKWWFVFMLWCTVTIAWALSPQVSLEQLPTSFSLVAFYIASSCFCYTDQELRQVTFLSVLGGCVAAIWTLYLFRQGSFYQPGPETRASLIVGGRATNPDILAMTLLLPTSLAFGHFLSYRHRLGKAIMLLAFMITTLGLFLTMSRAAVVALVVMLLVYVYRLRLGSRLIVPVLLLAILLAFMPPVFFVRLQEASSTGGSGRLDIWKVGLLALKDNVVFGAGLQNFPVAYTKHAGAAAFTGFARDSHNIYLCVAVETGIIGLLFFAGAMWVQLGAASRGKDHRDANNLLVAIEAAVWGGLAYGFFGNILWVKGFWLSLMLLTAVGSMSEGSSRRFVPPL